MNHPSTSGDIIRNSWPVEINKSLNLYLGTGRCGGCFDSYGLQHQSQLDPVCKRVSKTWLAHGEVWHRGKHGLDGQVPLVCWQWSELPKEPEQYRQHLELATGRLTTEFISEKFSYTLTAFTNPQASCRDLLFFHLCWSGEERPDLVLKPVDLYPSDYSGLLKVKCQTSLNDNCVLMDLSRGNSHGISLAQFKGDLVPILQDDAAFIQLKGHTGSGTFVIALGPISRAQELGDTLSNISSQDLASWKKSSEDGWKTRWGTKGITLPEPDHNALYWRSIYYLLCSYAPDVRCPPPPMGFTGNAWGLHFPQDLSYVHPALLTLGHSDITRAHVEFYYSRLKNQLELTREIYNKPGVCWSWEFPIGPDAKLFCPEDGGLPNEFQVEIHNAAYPARMAIETAHALADSAWTRSVAWPILLESARFLASGLKQESDGTYSMWIKPSMGQDEFGGPDAKNYLCALFAADYTLTQALKMAGELGIENADTLLWSEIMSGGMAYQRLFQPQFGFYAANESITFVPRCQKHPVQLNPLWILPLGYVDEPTKAAYRQRRSVCSTEREGMNHTGVPSGFYDGWTLFAFLLSAAQMKDHAGFDHEMSEMIPAGCIDPHNSTIYESARYYQPYYTTSMGLYLQAQHLRYG